MRISGRAFQFPLQGLENLELRASEVDFQTPFVHLDVDFILFE